MKLKQIALIAGLAWALTSCLYFERGLNAINSESLPEKQITLGNALMQRLRADSPVTDSTEELPEQNILQKKLDKMLARVNRIDKNKSDSLWTALSQSWEDFRKNDLDSAGLPFAKANNPHGASVISPKLNRAWIDLNIRLLKLSGEVRFGDALEKILYQSKVPVYTEEMLKSVIFTRVDDQIFVNLFGSSSMNYQHTTGGNVKIIQETKFPENQNITIKIECNDLRFMDVYIRIPSWAKNPTVMHGNVKYVPYPGQYCLVSRKWKTGDEIQVVLRN